MSHFHRSIFSLSILASLLLFGCATGTENEQSETQAPEWVTGALPESSDHVYFSGRGADSEGSQVRAEDDATAALVAEITRYLGVRVESETEAVARASLDDFESRVTRTVRQRSGARLEGLRVVDRYVESQEGEVSVYLLAGYERGALEAERERLTSMFQREIDAVEGSAERAQEHYDAGEYFSALRLYLQSAESALESDLENASQVARSSAGAARELAEGFRMRRIPEEEHASADTFVFETYYEHERGRDPIAGVPVVITYPAEGPGGRTTIRSARALSDGRGRVHYSFPEHAEIRDGSIHVHFDLDLTRLRTSEVGNDIRALSDALRESRLRIDGDHRAEPAQTGEMRSVSLAVVERDMEGAVVERDRTAGALADALADHGFRAAESAFSLGGAAGFSQQQIVAQAREALPSVTLVLSALVGVSDVSDSPDPLVRVDGSFYLIDADSGTAVASWSGFVRSHGSSVEAAEDAAFRRIGVRAAEELSRRAQ